MEDIIFYVTIGLCAAGSTIRIFLSGYYSLQLEALHAMKSTKNKGMKKLKERFILRYQAMLGVQNVESFVGRFLSEQKLLGISLPVWNGLHAQMISACLLLGALDAFYRSVYLAEVSAVMVAMFQGVWTSILLLLVDGFCMIPGKIESLKLGMQDYLENYLKVSIEHEYAVWGKNAENGKRSKEAALAQLQVADEVSYEREKKEERKRARMAGKRRVSKVQKDVVMLKKEVEERRKNAVQPEQRVNRQLDTLMRELELQQERGKRVALRPENL